MAILSIIFFFAAIILAFVRKNNIGILAMAIGVIAVRVFGLTDKDLIGGISVSLFTTLVGITLLFSIVTNTGALDLLARKIVALAGKRIWLLPILIALTVLVLVLRVLPLKLLMLLRWTLVLPELLRLIA